MQVQRRVSDRLDGSRPVRRLWDGFGTRGTGLIPKLKMSFVVYVIAKAEKQHDICQQALDCATHLVAAIWYRITFRGWKMKASHMLADDIFDQFGAQADQLVLTRSVKKRSAQQAN